MKIIKEAYVLHNMHEDTYKLGQNTSVPKLYAFKSSAQSSCGPREQVLKCYIVVEEEQHENTSNT